MLFGVDSQSYNHADKALAAGRALQRRLERLNLELAQRGEAPITIGIGINTGPAIVGSIGSPERMEFTVIGNTVNVASRVEGLNKILGTTLLLSKGTHNALQRAPALQALTPYPVKGVDKPVEIFTLAS